LKKPAGLARFRFYKQKTEKTRKNQAKPNQTRKTEPNQKNRENRAKTGKTEPNRFEPVFALKNQTETGWFDPVSVFFKKNSVWLFF
jgi:hypothetical protein